MSESSNIKSEIGELHNLKDVAEVLVAVSTINYMLFQNLELKHRNLFSNLKRRYDSIREAFEGSFTESPKEKLLIFIGADLAFAGNFNRLIKNKARDYFQDNSVKNILIIGKQISVLSNDFKTVNQIHFEKTSKLTDLIKNNNSNLLSDIDHNLFNTVNQIEIVYNSLDNRKITQCNSVIIDKLQIKDDALQANSFDDVLNGAILDPNKDTFFEKFISLYLSSAIKYTLIASIEAENYVRSTSMSLAQDEADLMIKRLKKKLNKIRQAKITKEIIEIINSYARIKK